jgi:uncharacterized protein (TIGR03083 family)
VCRIRATCGVSVRCSVYGYPMDTDRFVEHVRVDAETMSRIAHSAPLDTDVPTCPGWDLRELIVHTGAVHRHKVATLLGGYRDEPAPRPDAPGDGVSDADILSWFDGGAAQLLDAFQTADLDEPTWTWCPHDHTKDWWVRRMAHETVIHRVDAEISVGIAPTVDPWLAQDGVAEILDEFMVGGPPWGQVVPSELTVRLESGGRKWALRSAVFSGTSPYSGKTHEAIDALVYDPDAEPMATVTVDPATLDLWLWGRGDLPEGAIDGDASVAAHVRKVAAEATG